MGVAIVNFYVSKQFVYINFMLDREKNNEKRKEMCAKASFHLKKFKSPRMNIEFDPLYVV